MWPLNLDHTLQRDTVLQIIIRMCALICLKRYIQILAHLIVAIHKLHNIINENPKVTGEFLMHASRKNLSTLKNQLLNPEKDYKSPNVDLSQCGNFMNRIQI